VEANRHARQSAGSLAWNRRIGALPIYTAAAKDPMYADPRYKGWFEELADPNYSPMIMPMDLRAWALFASSIVPRTTQNLLLGKLTAPDMAQQWRRSSPRPNRARVTALGRRLASGAEPYLYTAPVLLLIVAIMLVPLGVGLSYAFATCSCSIPSPAPSSAWIIFANLSRMTSSATRCAIPHYGPAPR